MDDKTVDNESLEVSKKSKRNKIIIGVIVLILVCCCGALGFGSYLNSSSEDQDNESAQTEPEQEVAQEVVSENTPIVDEPVTEDIEENTPIPTEEPEPTSTLTPTDTPPPTETPIPTNTPNPNLVKPGTHIVGTDIDPEIYRGEAGVGLFDSCYWARLSDLTGDFDALLANDNSEGQFYVEVLDTDFALETDCELVPLSTLPEPSGEFPQELLPGSYIVGRDIQSGIYQGQAGTDALDSCYWARVSDFTENFDALIANDNGIGQFYVDVKSDDFGFKTQCELISLDALPEPSGEFPSNLLPGTYIVGRDIQPGTYKGEGGEDVLDSCYWARLSNLAGDFNSLIANDNSNGQFYVQVLESDFALSTACDLELVQE